jgi:hypothetical protein
MATDGAPISVLKEVLSLLNSTLRRVDISKHQKYKARLYWIRGFGERNNEPDAILHPKPDMGLGKEGEFRCRSMDSAVDELRPKGRRAVCRVAIAHLKGLRGAERERAFDYIRKAPGGNEHAITPRFELAWIDMKTVCLHRFLHW